MREGEAQMIPEMLQESKMLHCVIFPPSHMNIPLSDIELNEMLAFRVLFKS